MGNDDHSPKSQTRQSVTIRIAKFESVVERMAREQEPVQTVSPPDSTSGKDSRAEPGGLHPQIQHDAGQYNRLRSPLWSLFDNEVVSLVVTKLLLYTDAPVNATLHMFFLRSRAREHNKFSLHGLERRRAIAFHHFLRAAHIYRHRNLQ